MVKARIINDDNSVDKRLYIYIYIYIYTIAQFRPSIALMLTMYGRALQLYDIKVKHSLTDISVV